MPAYAEVGKTTVEVLGVITSGSAQGGIALVKVTASDKTFAARVGDKVTDDLVIERVTRDYVYFKSAGQATSVRVGEGYQAPSPYAIKGGGEGGIERKGNEVRMTTAYRNLLKSQMGKVLMQAAAVPYYANGELIGFRMWEIEDGSVFAQAGLQNGDVVTAINGERLTDVSRTIRMLQALRDEPRADITIERAGKELAIAVVVQ